MSAIKSVVNYGNYMHCAAVGTSVRLMLNQSNARHSEA